MRQRTKFNLDEAMDAVEMAAYLRLVRKWTGCIKLETNGKKIIITQFPDGNSWTRGYNEIYRIEEHEDWSDFVTGTDEEFDKLTRQQKWDQVDVMSMLETQIGQAEEKLGDILNEAQTT